MSAYCYSLYHSTSSGSALAKLKASGSGGLLKPQPGEKKETPQERLKRIMNKQLNKQSMTVWIIDLNCKPNKLPTVSDRALFFFCS